MEQLPPLQDTFSALAGVPVRRTSRPGETFERPATQRKPRWNAALIMRLLILGIFVKGRTP